MDNFKSEALSVIVSKIEVKLKEKMFDINMALSIDESSINIVDRIEVLITEVAILENSFNIAKDLLNQSLEANLNKLSDLFKSKLPNGDESQKNK